MKNELFIRSIFIFLQISLILSLCIHLPTATAESLYESGKMNWLQGKYQSAYDELIAYRKLPYGRRPDVDYMLGTCGCRLTGLQKWGAGVLDWMLYAYPLTANSRRLVSSERDICRNADKPLLTASAPVSKIEDEISAGMSARGKTFYWVDRDVPVNSYPIRRVSHIDPVSFQSRLTARDDAAAATEKIKSLVPDFSVESYRHFVIASSSRQTKEQMNDISETLENYITFLSKEYGFTDFKNYITIYLVPSVADFRQLAKKIHGLDVSQATIGYAFREDLSVVGVIPGKTIGTLLHELFHLAVRQDFGDIPQWLDEGIASLYEVSSAEGISFRGKPNWRGRVLKDLWNHRPTLQELVSSPWFPFDLPEIYDNHTGDKPSVRKQAAHMAMARYFVLYLQEKKKLNDVFTRVRDTSIDNIGTDARKHAIKIIEDSIGQPLASVHADFEKWFRDVSK